MERRVRVFRLKAEISGEHTLSREVFESLTLKHFPWHQPKDNHLKGAGEGNYYAVCPACTNPVQILGLYRPLPQTPHPYARHTGERIPGFEFFDGDAHQSCPYIVKHKPGCRDLKANIEGLPTRILEVLLNHFDRVIYTLEQDTGVRISPNLARAMLCSYLDGKGYLYVGATIQNIPWTFAYMANAHSLYRQTIHNNEAMKDAIRKRHPVAGLTDSGELGKGTAYYRILWSFILHTITAGDTLEETMKMVLADDRQRRIYTQEIRFDHNRFERLLNTPPERARRNPGLLKVAREEFESRRDLVEHHITSET